MGEGAKLEGEGGGGRDNKEYSRKMKQDRNWGGGVQSVWKRREGGSV